MRESKAELTDRLRREGRWEAFKKRREKLKAGGMDAKAAWSVAANEFPPPDAVANAVPQVDLWPLKDKPPVPVLEAAAWVFDNLDAPWVKPADAPSAGAWSLRDWARTNIQTKTEYYRTFAAKIVLKPQEMVRQEEEDGPMGKRDDDYFERMYGGDNEDND